MTPDQLKHAELEYLQQLAQQLGQAKHGTKGKIVTDAAAFLSISKAELYRRLERMGFNSGRKTRSDKGKCSVSPEQARLVGNMVYEATRQNGKRTTSIKNALKQAVANGEIPEVSTATITRAMNKNHCHPTMLETPKPYIEQRSLHPNHVWQVDASTCILFYLPKEDSLQNMHAREFNKNKPQNLKRIEKDMLTRYVVTDHYSGATYVEYVRGSESATNLITVLLNAMQYHGTKHPMHGVPFIIYTDKGSAMTSHLFTNLLARLGIRIIDHQAGNPRAKGQVESTQRVVENEFEGRLKSLNITSLDQLNALAHKWLAVFNATHIHSRHGKTRNSVWLKIKPEQLRIAPSLDICKELVTTKPVTKTVKGNRTITHTVKDHGNLTFRLDTIPDIYVKAKVEVVVNAYRMPDIDVHFADKVYTISPDKKDDDDNFSEHAAVIGEEMKAPKQTPVDIARITAKKEAYGVETEAELEQAIKAGAKPYQGRINPMADIEQTKLPDYMPKAGEELAHITPANRQLAPISHVEAAQQILGILNSEGMGHLWNAQCYTELTQLHPQNVPAEAPADIAQRIMSGKAVQHLKAVNE